jgi:hypothetical protein
MKDISATPGQSVNASIGSPFLTWQKGRHVVGGATRHELTYQGIDGDSIAVEYREFVFGDTGQFGGGWLAKPAFTQALKFDLTKSKEVSFREAKFRVEAADNNAIQLTVLRVPTLE